MIYITEHAKGYSPFSLFEPVVIPLLQGFPTGGTRTPWGYEIEHQGIRRSLGHRAAYISLIEQYISQNFFGGY